VPQSLSLSCASLKCSHLVCIWGCDPQNLSLQKHSEWVFLSPSIHISCRLHLWILVYSVNIQSLWLARLTAKKMPLFPLLLFISCCDSGVISAKSLSRMFLHFSFFSYHILFFVCLVNCWSEGLQSRSSFSVWILAVSFLVIWVECSYSVLAVSQGLSDLAHHACEEERVFVLRHHEKVILQDQESIDLWWHFQLFQIIHSHQALFFGTTAL